MTISFAAFVAQLTSNLPFFITTVLTLGVILVNGWTDAPNAIATCVSTPAILPRRAILLAAFCNFAGVLVMTRLNASVAETIYNIADFGGNPQDAHIALCAVMFAIVAWASLAWAFGFPTSKSPAVFTTGQRLIGYEIMDFSAPKR